MIEESTKHLGFYGSARKKLNAIKRMEAHMAADELTRSEGYLCYDLYRDMYKGCAVSCIAQPKLSAIPKRNTKEHVYRRTNRFLNIPYIAAIIDVVHERTDLEENFSLRFLKWIEIDVDYTNFSVDFLKSIGVDADDINAFVKRDGGYRIIVQAALSYFSTINRMSQLEDFIKEYNLKHKLVKSDG